MQIKNKMVISLLLFVVLFSLSCSIKIPSANQEKQDETAIAENPTIEIVESKAVTVVFSDWEILGENAILEYGELFGFDSTGILYAGFSTTLTDGSNISYIQKWDGNSWQMLGQGFAGHVRAIAIGVDGTVYAASKIGGDNLSGEIDSSIFMWSYNTWNLVATINGFVSRLVIDTNGNLYAGGFFTSINGLGMNNVAKFDGNNWHTTDWGDEDQSVQNLVISPDGLLYAVGDNRLSKWDGVVWTPLHFGGDVYETFRYITVDSYGNLYTTGEYTKDGIYQHHLSKLEQSNWSFIKSKYITNEDTSIPELLGFSNDILYGLTWDSMNPEKNVVFGWGDTGEFEIPVGNSIFSIVLSPYENALYGVTFIEELDELMVVKMKLPVQ